MTRYSHIAIPGSLWNTTTMDGVSADIAGANICTYILDIKKPQPKLGFQVLAW
jgi:hypothetical protein